MTPTKKKTTAPKEKCCKYCGTTINLYSVYVKNQHMKKPKLVVQRVCKLCRSLKIKKTKLNKYGDENYNNIKQVKITQKNNTKEDWEKIAIKSKKTREKKYGKGKYGSEEKMKQYHTNNTKEQKISIVKKIKKTKLEKYGNEKYNNIEKVKKTKLEKYNNPVYTNIKKTQETRLNKINKNGLNINQIVAIKTKEMWKSFSKEDRENIRRKTKETFLEKYGQTNPMKNEIIKEKARQTSLSRYGVTNPILIYGNNYSKISQELFWKLYGNIREQYKQKTYFGELNKEFMINDNGNIYCFDFVISSLKKCIEFHGDVWHGNPSMYKETDRPQPFSNLSAKTIWNKDKEKISSLEKRNYSILVIWEHDYKNNKDFVINKCLNFIK